MDLEQTIINKIDELGMEESALQYYELGLGDYFMISAQNNRSIGDLLDDILDKTPENYHTQKIETKNIDLAIIGMPNVGKSSLVNCIINKDKSIVTDIAGTTRDAIDSYITYYIYVYIYIYILYVRFTRFYMIFMRYGRDFT